MGAYFSPSEYANFVACNRTSAAALFRSSAKGAKMTQTTLLFTVLTALLLLLAVALPMLGLDLGAEEIAARHRAR